jgi:ABC-type multidrug transport system ATPase subunit
VSCSPLVSLSAVHKAYRAGVPGCSASVDVLTGVSLTVSPGQLISVDGPVASGKTTLLFTAAGMLRADAGTVAWPALPPRPGRPPLGIGYVSDRAPPYPYLTVRDTLRHAATLRALHRPSPGRSLDALLARCGLTEVADVRIGLLGAAARERLALAAALVSEPQLLLVDGLRGGDDAIARQGFVHVLAGLAAEGLGVLWAARDLGLPAAAAVGYQLQRGRLLCAARAPHRPALERRVARVAERALLAPTRYMASPAAGPAAPGD